MQTVLVVGDCHFPFTTKKSLTRILSLAQKIKPDVIVQVGDLYDHYAHAKFPRSHNVMTPRQEIEKAREMAENMWSKLQSASPKSSCYQLLGNHDIRPYKRILERYPEVEKLMGFQDFYRFDGVDTVFDPRTELVIDDVLYIHGYLSGLGKHAIYNLRSVVCGHSHLGGVYYQRLSNDRVIFELNAGFIADIKSTPLSYTAQRYTKWTQGCGIIDEHGPRFCPFD